MKDEYHETVDAVIDGVIDPPPGFERFVAPDVEARKELAKVLRSMTAKGREEDVLRAWAEDSVERREEEH